MKIAENEDEIILRDIPLFSWVIGILCSFIFGGCFLWMIFEAVYNPREAFHSQDGTWAGSVMAVAVFIFILVVVGALLAAMTAFIFSSVITTKINRKLNFIEISRRNLWRKNVKRFEFSQVKRFDTESRVTGETGLNFFVVLKLQNNRVIEIEEKGFSGEEIEAIIKRLNEFAGFPAKRNRAKVKRSKK